MSDACLFCRIVRGEIPAARVYEDAEILAFRDIDPVRQVHVLLIPKKHIASLASVAPEDQPLLGRMLAIASSIATQEGSPDGFRTIINTGRIGHQEIPHLHMHIIGGSDPVGPMVKKI